MQDLASLNKELADGYVEKLPERDFPNPKVFMIFSGMPGSGKTTLAKRLAADLHAQYIHHDKIRDVLVAKGIDPDHVPMAPISTIIMSQIVENDANKFIILDGSLDRSWPVFFNNVKELSAIPIIIRFDVPIDIIEQRLTTRDQDNLTLRKKLDRYKLDFDNSCRHVQADLTLGETYNYDEVLSLIKQKIDQKLAKI